MTTPPRIALVIGSARLQRFADKPADWLLQHGAEREDLALERLDLRDFDLPFYESPQSTDPRVLAWQEAIGGFDGYLFVVAEYNHAMTGVLKNALDLATVEWRRKPFSAFGYGSVGGARAVENLRTAAIELQMVPSKFSAHLGGSDLFRVHPFGADGSMSEIEAAIKPSVDAMFDDLAWWATTLREARTLASAA